MATSKQYAWYLEGNQIAIVEKDVSFDNDVDSKNYGPGASRQRWESPQSTVIDGLEVKYVYAPTYRLSSHTTTNINKFYVNGWTLHKGYLTFLRNGSDNDGVINWQDAPENAVTSGTQGGDDDYIVVKGSDRWNGLHKVQTAGNYPNGLGGMLVTYTKVNQSMPYIGTNGDPLDPADIQWTGEDSAGISSLHTADDSLVFLSSIFNTGDYMWANSEANNTGLYKISSTTTDAVAQESSDKIYMQYSYHVAGTGSDATANASLLNEEQIDTTDVVAGAFGAGEADHFFGLYKAERDFCYLLTDVEVLQDESFEIDLPNYLQKALVYYIKGKMAEDAGELKIKMYFDREFKKMIEKHENSRISGLRITSSGSHAIR